MPDTDWPISGHPPASSRTALKPRFRCRFLPLGTSSAFTCVRLSGSTPDNSYAAFSSTLTTTVFSQRSSRWFDASPHRATPEGHNSSIFYAAPHHKGSTPTCRLLSARAAQQCRGRHPHLGLASEPCGEQLRTPGSRCVEPLVQQQHLRPIPPRRRRLAQPARLRPLGRVRQDARQGSPHLRPLLGPDPASSVRRLRRRRHLGSDRSPPGRRQTRPRR